MHEFTSISVSSYDAASLADKLTEKSAAGWDVVAIVPAGTNITAYLSREAEAAEQVPTWDTGSEDSTSTTPDEAAAPASTGYDTEGVTTPTYAAQEVEEPAPVWEPEPVAEEPAAVEEPAGWAVAPEPASPTPASVGVAEASPEPAPYIEPSSGYSTSQPASEATSGYVDEPRLGSTGYDTGATGYDTGTSSGAAADSAPSTGYDTGAGTAYDSGAAADSAPGTGYDTGTTTESATVDSGTGYDAGTTTESATVASSAESTAAAEQTTAAAASAAPAGWYADPSGRYELRYWDGTQWTEHVSRAGQQYTDPPVA